MEEQRALVKDADRSSIEEGKEAPKIIRLDLVPDRILA